MTLLNLKNIATALLIGGIGIFGIVQHSQISALRERLDRYEKHEAWFEKQTREQIGMLASQPTQVAVVPPEAADHLEKLASAQAQAEAERDAVMRKLMQTQQKQQQFRAELNKVRADASNANAQLSAVSSEVGQVKTELATRDSKFDKSLGDLKRVMGDLGVQSQLIATNRRELDALRAIGDRNYFDFEIRGKGSKRVADVTITVKKWDSKKSRFTIEVLSNDKRIEKKERGLNEPVQFYVAKPHPPYDKIENELYEIVVNDIRADHISGYMTTPRVLAAAR